MKDSFDGIWKDSFIGTDKRYFDQNGMGFLLAKSINDLFSKFRFRRLCMISGEHSPDNKLRSGVAGSLKLTTKV